MTSSSALMLLAVNSPPDARGRHVAPQELCRFSDCTAERAAIRD